MIEAEVEIINGGELALLRRGYISEGEVRRVKTAASFDGGNFRIAVGEDLRELLGLEIVDRRRLLWASGEEIFAAVAEFIELRFENRRMTTQPFVLPDISNALLGSFILTDLDLITDGEKTLLVNPKSPNRVRTYLK